MKNKIIRNWAIFFCLFVFVMISACSDNGKNKKESEPSAVGTNQMQSGIPETASSSIPMVTPGQPVPTDVAVSVDGKVLKKSDLENNIKDKMKMLKAKIPGDKQKEFRESVRKRLIEEFIMKTLLADEIAKRKIEVSDQEIKTAMNEIKAGIPQNKNVDDFLKENKISKEDIILGIKVRKLVKLQMGKNTKPTEAEISKFYNENKDKLFVAPESVHVRHILVAVDKKDNDKVKAEKKEKIENIRKQLLKGDDFAELARKNSDCPSKEMGGDLKFISRGQTVKKFEDAAFSQEKNIIGPVVETEYGYHIIQVLDRKPSRKVALDEVKDKIAAYLEQQKHTTALTSILKKLQQNAKIVVY